MNPVRSLRTESFVIGLDCSTTSVKAIAVNKNGKVFAHAQESIPLYSPRPNHYEQDSNDWWNASQNVLRQITKQIDPGKISAIAISNQRETFVALDRYGTSLRPAIIWLDERCKDEVESFAKKIGANKIHRITGKPVDYAPVVYRLAWMKKHEPKIYKNISMICDVHTYLSWKLTGTFKTSWASADPLGLFDLKNKRWSTIILDELNLVDEQLPQTFSPGSILGIVTSEISRLTGLSKETLIVAGGGDGQAAGTGANALTPECAYLNLGTAVVAGIYGLEYRTNKAFRTMCSCSDNGYYFECSLRAGTFAIDWLIKNILKIDPLKQLEIYKELEQEAEKIPAGCDGLLHLPYLCGVMNPYWDKDARGAFIGLSSFHNRGHMYRAILEGIAFEQLFAIEAVEKNIGTTVKDFVVIGGGSASYLWCQIIADVTGKNICIPENSEASGLGAAIAASIGIGWFETFKEASNKMSGIKKRIIPGMKVYKEYQKYFTIYKNIYPGLKKVNPSL
jgi:sugar (pentulose or hexulose) kinase